MCFHDCCIFFIRPPVLFDVGVQMIKPSFPALLANSSGEVLGDFAPIFRTVHSDQLYNDFVFLFGPGSLSKLGVQHLLPSVQTLDICPIREERSNFFPVSSPILFNNSL